MPCRVLAFAPRRRPAWPAAARALLVAVVVATSAAGETAEDLLRQRRLPEAEAAFAARVQAHDGDADAHHQLGRLILARRDFQAAIPHLERAGELAPHNAMYQFHLGAACVQHADELGKTFKALGLARRGRQAMERAVDIAPDVVEFQLGLIEFYSRAPGIAGGGTDKARAAALAFRQRHPREGAVALAGVHLRARQPAEAVRLYEQLLAENADDYQVLYLLGRAAADTGESLSRGIASLRRCLELSPPPRSVPPTVVHHQLGRALEKAGEPDAARRSYEAALALAPDNAAARAALEALP